MGRGWAFGHEIAKLSHKHSAILFDNLKHIGGFFNEEEPEVETPRFNSALAWLLSPLN